MRGCLVIMGVSGCGKSTLGRALAQHLGWEFVEGDALHPAANIAKMAAGIALDDADRVPFLHNVAQCIATGPAQLVITCSALKRSYRDLLRAAGPRVLFVLPVLSREQLQGRLQQRRAHFMPASLLDSQLAALEMPQADEPAILVDAAEPTPRQVDATLAALAAARFHGG